MTTLEQIKERKLVRWTLAYLAGAWLVLQVTNLVADRFGWPDAWMRGLIVVSAVGLLAALVLAWYHGERGAQRVSGVEFALLTGLFVIAGAAVAFVGEGGAAVAEPAEPLGAVGLLAAVEVPAEQASLAVLPFVNMSADPEQAFFSDGLAEELLNVLAQIPGLRVAARTSSFAFEGTGAGADSIGRALGVAHLVQGSVRRSGDRLRITAQLVDARTGFQQWSQSYDRELADVFAVQDEISRAIAAELHVRVGRAPLARQATDDPQAYELFLRAGQAVRQGSAPNEYLGDAERLFRAALARDPGYAAALAGLANVHLLQAYYGLVEKESGYTLARAGAERAIALDAGEAVAHRVLAMIADMYGRDYEAAVGHYRQALSLNPNDAISHSNYGWLLMRLGRTEDALREGRRAVELDPLSVGSLGNLGSLYNYAQDSERAAEQYRAALALNPDDVVTLTNLSVTYSDLSRHAEAARTAERALALDPAYDSALMAVAYTYARAGRRADAERALERLARSPNVSPYLLSTVHAALGNRDRAFALLERAVEENDDYVVDLGMDPVFEPLRGDPRFALLLARLGLPASSAAASR